MAPLNKTTCNTVLTPSPFPLILVKNSRTRVWPDWLLWYAFFLFFSILKNKTFLKSPTACINMAARLRVGLLLLLLWSPGNGNSSGIDEVLRKGTFELLLVCCECVCGAGWWETQNVGHYSAVSGCNGNQLWTLCVCTCSGIWNAAFWDLKAARSKSRPQVGVKTP